MINMAINLGKLFYNYFPKVRNVRLKRLLRSGSDMQSIVVLLIGRLAMGVGSFVSIRLITELIPPAQMGKYYYILAISGFGHLVLASPVGIYVSRMCMEWKKEGRILANFHTILYYEFAAGLFCVLMTAIYLVTFDPEMGDVHEVISLTILATTMVFLGSICSMLTTVVNFLGKRVVFVALTNLKIWGNLLFVSAAILLLSRTAKSMLIGQVVFLSALAYCIIYLFWNTSFLKQGETVSNKKFPWKYVWKFCWPLALTQVFFWGQLQGFRIPLKLTGGEHGVGVFSVFFGLVVGLFSLFDSIFNQFYAPVYWAKVAEKKLQNADLNLYAKFQWPNLIVFTLWVLGIAPFIVNIAVSAPYRGYANLMVWITIAEAIRLSGTGHSYGLNAVNRNILFLLPAVLSFAIVIGLTYGLGHVMDPLVATGIALMINYSIQVSLIIFLARNEYNVYLPIREAGWGVSFGFPLWSFLFVIHHTGYISGTLHNLGVLSFSVLLLFGAFWGVSRCLNIKLS
jgi:O-antigen/teichoic acid export membrane protein